MAMDDSFQFIIESPQYAHGQKKRPRLVTSCDNCRLKKIKCMQPNPESKCEACKGAKIPCRFKDREKYFAERSRAIATPPAQPFGDPRSDATQDFQPASTSSSPAMSHADVRPSSRSPKTSGLVSPDSDYGRYQPYPADSTRRSRHAGSPSITSLHTRSNSHNSTMHYDYGPPQPQAVLPISLFDSDHLNPHPTLMQQFVPLFFEHHSRDYPFLAQDDIYRQCMDRRMSPILANCIAMLASRHHSSPDLASPNTELAYMQQAKSLCQQLASSQKQALATVQALVMLGWSDYYRNHYDGFRHYSQYAMQLSVEMRLPEYKYVQSADPARNSPAVTWSHVLHMQQTMANARPGMQSRLY